MKWKTIQDSDGNVTELEMELIMETKPGEDHSGAILVSDGGKQVWIPKSQLVDGFEIVKDNYIVFVIPEWMAYEKELI